MSSFVNILENRGLLNINTCYEEIVGGLRTGFFKVGLCTSPKCCGAGQHFTETISKDRGDGTCKACGYYLIYKEISTLKYNRLKNKEHHGKRARKALEEVLNE